MAHCPTSNTVKIMTNFKFIETRLKFPPIDRVAFLLSRCSGKKVLDLGCIQHSSEWATKKNSNWLHKKLYDVAHYVLGIDYLEPDVIELRRLGFNIIHGDVTKPLHLVEKFDVIIAGNLIEHLDNFEGFFNNLKNWLSFGGEILISTANPFYIDQYFYTAFKNNIVINPEHTCWIDPIALNQLAERFNFTTKEFYFVKDVWKLGFLISESKTQIYDMFHGKWLRIAPPRIGMIRNIFRKSLTFLYFLYCKFTSRFNFNKYDELEREDLLERYVVERLFQLFWFFYKLFIVKSDLNKYELYISVLTFK